MGKVQMKRQPEVMACMFSSLVNTKSENKLPRGNVGWENKMFGNWKFSHVLDTFFGIMETSGGLGPIYSRTEVNKMVCYSRLTPRPRSEVRERCTGQ